MDGARGSVAVLVDASCRRLLIMGGIELVARAAIVAERLLARPLPRRWRHVQAVAVKAQRIGPGAVPNDAAVLVAAAWLHDIGYAPEVADTGLHALDGARWLVREGFDARLAGLVAYHSGGLYEADEHGLANVLVGEFADERSPTADALWFVDMTTGPDGQDMTVKARLAEIRQRYGADDPVVRCWSRAEPILLEAVQRTQRRLEDYPM